MMAQSPEGPPRQRKIPKQHRAIVTCDAIVEAAARILERDGSDSLNTNRIAETAGVSVGTLYQYFPDKSAILAALVRREREAMLNRLQSIPKDTENVLDSMIDEAIRHQFARPKLASLLERIERSLSLDDEAQELIEDISSLSSDLLAARFGRLNPEDLRTAILIAQALVNAAGDGVLPTEGLGKRVSLAVSGYLENVRTGSLPQ